MRPRRRHDPVRVARWPLSPWVVRGEDGRRRCAWAGDGEMRAYHDEEWGVPVHDDRVHYEFLVLEGAQAGLSWSTILRKREAYRRAFAGFDPVKVARFDGRRAAKVLADTGIVRNRAKIASAIRNAKAFLEVQREFASFDAYLWRFAPGRAATDAEKSSRDRRGARRERSAAPRELTDVPAKTAESEALSKDLLRRGFNFVGPTVMYAHMQAVGLVNDHMADCFRRREIVALARRRGTTSGR